MKVKLYCLYSQKNLTVTESIKKRLETKGIKEEKNLEDFERSRKEYRRR
jgi:hypothetical protein